jgi:hypothetical protein
MQSRDAELFEAIAGDLLEELGYGRSIEKVSRKVSDIAAQCCTCWEQQLARERDKFHHRLETLGKSTEAAK